MVISPVMSKRSTGFPWTMILGGADSGVDGGSSAGGWGSVRGGVPAQKESLTEPMAISSPTAKVQAEARRWPLTQVPRELSTSSMRQDLPSQVKAACFREISN